MLRFAALMSSLTLLGCGARTPLYRSDDVGAPTTLPRNPNQARADRIDLLFVIDDSGSMSDKQQIFAKALPDMVNRLINPLCVHPSDLAPAAEQPAGPLDACPTGTLREFNSVQDLHVGVITSSLGGVGASVCGPAASSSSANRRGRLVTSGVGTYQDEGFVAWDPAGTKSPPGVQDVETFRSTVTRLLNVGENGCPYEMPLEAMYRFLIDPEPYDRVVIGDCEPGSGRGDCATLDGIDDTVLEQRGAFLRPNSLVAIILLSDENDCSLSVEAAGHRMFDAPGTVARGTSACVDPEDRCCHSCDEPAREGCTPPSVDAECARGPYPPEEDGGYLRCFDQKKRFGVERRYPIERYVGGLRGDPVPGRDGALVPNPLFHDAAGGYPPRDPSLVFFAAIVGVPWQDVAVAPDDSSDLVYKTATQMSRDYTWDVVVGDPRVSAPPLDPLMHESIEERQGQNPVTHDALAPSTSPDPWANPINGHEGALSPLGFSIQTACIFDLPAPVSSLECGGFGQSRLQAVCQADDGSYGSLQYRAAAYPGRRALEVSRGMGESAIVGSICARNVTDALRSDYGYRPALKALLDRLRVGIQ